jgi:biopolymer transport protein ExbB
MGMVTTFESLATRSGQRSIEGLADGISMALVTTETGLAIAIPAFIISYHAQRQLQLGIQKLTDMESELMGA